MSFNKNIIIGVISLLCFVIALAILWVNLGEPQIRMWDEATYALNSIDMFLNGNYLLTSTNGVPDFYNSQPQLVIWAQTICLHLFGVSEFSIRFPSALAASLLLLFFLYYFRKKPLLAPIIILILVSIPGYVGDHVTRTGDIDSMLILWISIAVFSWYKYIVEDLKPWRLIFFVAVLLAIMTKGIAIFMMLPGILIGGLILNIRNPFYKDWKNYVALGLIFLVITAYYLARENIAPGYLHYVYQNSFGRFFGNIHQWDQHPWHYYFGQIWNRDFTLIKALIPIIVLALFLDGKYIKLHYYLLMVACTYLCVITISSTKTYWYDAPLYPILAASAGIAILTVIERLTKRLSERDGTPILLSLCLVILLLTTVRWQYNKLIISEIYTYEMELEGLFLRHLSEQKLIKHPYTVLKNVRHPEEHFDQAIFYIIKNKLDLGINGYTAVSPNEIETDYVLVCQRESKQTLSERFNNIDTIYSWKQGSLFLKIRRVAQEPPADF